METQALSKYCKDELPTWDEFYNVFFTNKEYLYNPCTHLKIDPYWNKPYRKLLLAWSTNQLNKMILEDGYGEKLLAFINTGSLEYLKIFFTLSTGRLEECCISKNQIDLHGPYVYRHRLPDGSWSIFRNKDISWIDIFGDFKDEESLQLAIGCIRKPVDGKVKDAGFLSLEYIYPDFPLFHDIMEMMLTEMTEYFKDTPGWKDAEGNLLPTESTSRKCGGSGVDAAL